MKPIFSIFLLFVVSACDVDQGPEPRPSAISNATYRQAIATAVVARDVVIREQVLRVSRADVARGSFAVLELLPGQSGRLDQPRMASEVIPLAEQALGCSFPSRRQFSDVDYMPRSGVVVLPIECVDIIDLELE